MFCSGCCNIHEGHRQLHSHLRFGIDNLRDLSYIVTCLCESPITVPLASWLFSSCEEVQCITYSCGRKKSKSLQDSSVGCGPCHWYPKIESNAAPARTLSLFFQKAVCHQEEVANRIPPTNLFINVNLDSDISQACSSELGSYYLGQHREEALEKRKEIISSFRGRHDIWGGTDDSVYRTSNTTHHAHLFLPDDSEKYLLAAWD